MADIIQDVILRVSSDAEDLRKGVGQVDDKIKETNKNTGGLQNQFKKLLPALGVAAIIAGFKKIATASLQAADVQAKAEQKLLTAANGRIGVQQKLIKQAQDLQKVTTFGDEQTIEAQARLLPLLNGNADAVQQLIPLIQDLSVFTGMDLASAADLVGKSVGSSTNALSRYGIQIEGAVGSSERLESAIASLNSRAGGQAAAAAQVGLGGWVQFKNIIGDFMEEIGFLLLDGLNPLFKVMKDGAGVLVTFMAQLRGAEKATGSWAKVIDALRQPFVTTIEYTKDWYDTLVNVFSIFGKLIQRTGVVGDKFDLLSEIISFSMKPLEVLFDAMTGILAITNGVAEAVDSLATNFNKITQAFKDFDITKPFESIKEITDEIGQVGSGTATAFQDGFNEIFKKGKVGRKEITRSMQDAGQEGGLSLIDGIIKGAEKAAKEVDMSKVARELQVELYESLSEYMEAEAPEFKDELENALRIKLGIDTEESTADVDTWLKENKEKTDEVDFKPKIDGDEIVKGIDQILRTSKDLIDSLPIGEKAQKEIERLDELIEKQKEAVDKAKTYAEEGNSEQLALEENRLSRLENLQKQEQQQKEQALKRSLAIQKSMALAEIAINLATTLSNIDKTSAALGPLGIPLKTTQTLQAIAQAAINTASVLSANASFFEGTEDTGKGGRLDSKGGFAAILHPNERVMTAQQNKRIKQALGNVSNDDLVKMIENSKSLSVNPGGLLVDSSAINEKMNTKMDEMISLNREMLKAMKRNGVNVSIDRNGLSVMMHQMVQRQNILNSL
jgi:hypothetical protein